MTGFGGKECPDDRQQHVRKWKWCLETDEQFDALRWHLQASGGHYNSAANFVIFSCRLLYFLALKTFHRAHEAGPAD
jgi:hypothetical protein